MSALTYLIVHNYAWRPLLSKNIAKLEQIQRRATKYIFCDYSDSYKQRLTTLGMLPLYLWIYCSWWLKTSSNHKITLISSTTFTSSSKLGSNHKLAHNYTRCNKARHFYFNRVVRLWNEMPRINLNMSYREIKNLLLKFFWASKISTQINCVLTMSTVLALTVSFTNPINF